MSVQANHDPVKEPGKLDREGIHLPLSRLGDCGHRPWIDTDQRILGAASKSKKKRNKKKAGASGASGENGGEETTNNNGNYEEPDVERDEEEERNKDQTVRWAQLIFYLHLLTSSRTLCLN